MIRVLSVIALLSLSVSSVFAKNIVFNASQLPYDPLKASCKEMIQKTNHNKYTKLLAAHLYLNGKHMGKKCMKTDYIKAFKLYEELKMQDEIQRILQGLQYRADNGDSFAPFTLRKLRKAGYELKK